MKYLIVIGEEIHNHALRHARSLGAAPVVADGTMHAPLDDQVRTWIHTIWDSAEAAIRNAYRDGMAAAQPLIERATAQLAELAVALGRGADQVKQAIMERLDGYLQDAIDQALGRVRPSIKVGGRELVVTGVTIEQKVKFSGSVKASLQEVCEFVAEGELSLAAAYASPRAP